MSTTDYYVRMTIQKKFGKKLKEIRKSENLTQEKLAELASIDRSYISDVERGVKNISLEKIGKLAEALDMQIWELLKF